MDGDYFFYEQTRFRSLPKRFKKMPEDLPDSLKYAHLNPKVSFMLDHLDSVMETPDVGPSGLIKPSVAAYLASKEKQKHEEDMFGDGMGKKSLMPEISQAFTAVKNRLDSSLSNDEDSQRYLFEEARQSAATTLQQLARVIYFYDNISQLIPRSLELQMMAGFVELAADVQVVPRDWQTYQAKEAYYRRLTEAGQSDEEQDKIPLSVLEDGRSSRGGMSNVSESVKGGPTGPAAANKKRLLSKAGAGLPEIVEDSEGGMPETGKGNLLKRSDSRQSVASRRSRGGGGGAADKSFAKQGDPRAPGSTTGKSPGPKRGYHDYDFMSALTETPSDNRSTAMANPSYYMSVIQFQLSSKACEEKGWIVQRGKEEELAKEAVLEYCVQRLLTELKLIKDQKAEETKMGFTTPPVVRYYGDLRKESLLKYRKSPTRSSPNLSMREGKPRIPNMYDDHNEGRQLMITTHIDGTTIAYYPSGRTAVVVAAAGFDRPGYYTIVYDDDPDMRMLATFTPSGRGVCYHMNGNVRFLATTKGGHLANKSGKVLRQWKWPQAQVKLTTPVQFQLNQYLGFRCVSESYTVVVLTCQKESHRFFVCAAPGASEQPRAEDADQLLTAFTFSSRAAKDLLRLFAPKVKTKSKRRKDKMSKQLAEIVKSVDNQDKLIYDMECDRELARLQRKAKNLVDDWLEHYRVTIGLQSPMLIKVSDSPRARPRSRAGAFSAKTSADGRETRRTTLGLSTPSFMIDSARVPSAPSRANPPKYIPTDGSDSEAGSPNRLSSQAVKFDQQAGEGDGHDNEDRPFTSTFSDKMSRMSASSFRSKSASSRTKSAVSRQPTVISMTEKENTFTNVCSSNNLNLCPIAVRMQMLGEARPACRCSRHTVPIITDVEYYSYIQSRAPRNQLQIIVVVSSLHPQTHSEMMLNQIYQNQNKNRTRPCLQSGMDLYRVLKYDINTAGDGSDHTQPLLLTRHNVVPGMFLIYADGKLLFCDHIFNGYGNATRDFKKQVMKSRLDFIHGFSLPEDFRFSPSKGSHGPRAPWGGEIGGAGVDFYGNSGTLLTRSLTDIGGIREDGVAEGQGDNVNAQVQDLPPIYHIPRNQRPGYGRFNQHDPLRNSVGTYNNQSSIGPHGNQKRVVGISQLGPIRGRLGRSNTTLQTLSLRNNDLTFV